jgi:PAS domain S-box-containing protein
MCVLRIMNDDLAASISRRLVLAVVCLLVAGVVGVMAIQETATARAWVVLGCVVAGAGLSGWAALTLRGKTVAPCLEAEVAKAEAERLESWVRERAAQLTMSNQALLEENLERRWANQTMEHQLRYAQAIIDALLDPVLIVSKALNITRLNPAALKCTGYEASAVVGGPVGKIMVAEGEPGRQWEAALKAGERLESLSVWLLTAGGVHKPAQVSVVPLVDGKQVVASVVILRVKAGDAARARS